jgi:L-alanine-DL-glutamate epimerase-like enolase superfamily enzyme
MGGFRTSIPAYASTVTFDTIQQYLDVADQCRELGYGGIKLHAWGDVARDVRLIHALRAHVGDGFPLMYDGSAGFDLPDAIRVGHALAAADYLWYEEPMREFSVTAYKLLGEKVNVPLLVAETSDGAHLNAADFIASGCAIFGVRTSTRLRGGITGALRVAHLADSFRLRAEVHGADMTSRHLCMSIPNTTYFESMIRSDTAKRDPALRADGTIPAPMDPGIALPADLELPPELKSFQEEAGTAQGIHASSTLS